MADFNKPQSRTEAVLQNILGAENELSAPQSRVEAILQNILGAENELSAPQSRVEELLMAILEQGGGGNHDLEDEIINNTLSGVYRNDRVTYVATQRFRGQEQLTDIIFPNVEEAASSAFYNCPNLERIYMPKLRTVGPQVFAIVQKAKILAFPSLSSVSTGCFGWNSTVTRSELEVLDLGGNDSEASIANNAFVSTSLRVLILRNSSVTQLANTGAFLRTPFALDGTGGTLYIHKVLYDHIGDGSLLDYKAATNWSTILNSEHPNNQILPIEGSIYETQYADGTPIS